MPISPTRFIFDNEDILLELDGSNNITARYTHGPGIDEPLIIEKGGASFFYHADGLGSITEITDATGALRQQYTYSSFGKIESQLDPGFIQPYAFTSREFDPETGLYHLRKRTLDPNAGRFNQEDPILSLFFPHEVGLSRTVVEPTWGLPRVMRTPQSLNPHIYVRNNPGNRIDPFGLAETCTWFGVNWGGCIGIGWHSVNQKGICQGDCGTFTRKTRNCLCFCVGAGLWAGGTVESGDTSRETEGWSVSITPNISISGSGSTVTGGGYGFGLQATYSWCSCDVF